MVVLNSPILTVSTVSSVFMFYNPYPQQALPLIPSTLFPLFGGEEGMLVALKFKTAYIYPIPSIKTAFPTFFSIPISAINADQLFSGHLITPRNSRRQQLLKTTEYF
jgi:hypothetical protein